MEESVRRQLFALNRTFYREFADSFAQSRSEPQPGFHRLLEYLPEPCNNLLDVGCGEGRLGRFLLARGRVKAYEGLDGSPELIAIAHRLVDGRFWQRDLGRPDALEGLGVYDGVACLAVLQHIPGRDVRVRLLSQMGAHLAAQGRLIISTWQFLGSERQRKKLIDWSAVGLSPETVGPNDYLMTWRKGGKGLRYVCYVDEDEMVSLAKQAGLLLLDTYRSDGREGDLNLYSVLGHR
ncbi:MAG: class I SAM-dependent methyltransferase [Chloroflexota bacterium]|nr:MAG: class I SAM-dependent methyltransferase [Chloroflexota bacterium]